MLTCSFQGGLTLKFSPDQNSQFPSIDLDPNRAQNWLHVFVLGPQLRYKPSMKSCFWSLGDRFSLLLWHSKRNIQLYHNISRLSMMKIFINIINIWIQDMYVQHLSYHLVHLQPNPLTTNIWGKDIFLVLLVNNWGEHLDQFICFTLHQAKFKYTYISTSCFFFQAFPYKNKSLSRWGF